MMIRTFFSLTLVILGVTRVVGGELPSDVQTLVTQRSTAIERIDEKFIEELEKSKLRYTKMGNLEVANQIQALMQEVGKNAATKEFIASDLIGKWNVVYSHKGVRQYEFDGTKVTMTSGKDKLKGAYERIPSGFLINLGDQKLEVWSQDRDTWKIQHFNPASDYHEGRPAKVTGVAKKAE